VPTIKLDYFYSPYFFILQIVSISLSWEDISLQRTFPNGDTEQITMGFPAEYVDITHSYYPSSGNALEIDQSASCYYDSTEVNSKTNILFNLSTNDCPPTKRVEGIFPSITGTSAAAIISEFLMIVWLFYRTSNSGIYLLFREKCSTQFVSIIISCLIIGFSTASFSLYPNRLETAIYQDFGAPFFTSYGCSMGWDLDCYGYCSPNNCQSISGAGAGWIMSVSNMGMLVIAVIYTWIGSWCCECCCPGAKPPDSSLIIPSTTQYGTSINYPEDYLTALQPRTITLFVHHGGPLPSKMVLVASNFQELEMGVGHNLGLTVPFKMVVYDEMSKQYVMINDLALVQAQATVQILFK